MKMHSIRIAALLMCILFLPALTFADEMDDRIAALESRVSELEAQLAQLLPPQTPPPSPAQASGFDVGETLQLSDGLTITIKRYETGTRFRYYPAGGFFSSTLSARTGYQLVCVFIRIENNSSEDVSTSKLLDAALHCGVSFSTDARDSLFHLTNHGVYAAGLKVISRNSSVDACLLFALPNEAIASGEYLSMELVYHDTPYTCVLRESGAPLSSTDDPDTGF